MEPFTKHSQHKMSRAPPICGFETSLNYNKNKNISHTLNMTHTTHTTKHMRTPIHYNIVRQTSSIKYIYYFYIKNERKKRVCEWVEIWWATTEATAYDSRDEFRIPRFCQ